MPPRIDHRKPVVAFAVLVAVAAAVIGLNLRADAQGGHLLAAGLLGVRGPVAVGTLAAPGPSVPARTDPGRSPASHPLDELPLAKVILDAAPVAPVVSHRPAVGHPDRAPAPSRTTPGRQPLVHRVLETRSGPRGRGGFPALEPPGAARGHAAGARPRKRGQVPGRPVRSAGRAVRGLTEHPGLGRLVVRR